MTEENNNISEELLDTAQEILNDANQDEATQAFLNSQQEILQEQREANKEALSDDLAPFMGISLEAWAGANARIAQMEDLEVVIKDLGVDNSTWDTISQEWNDRMARDTTSTIATVFGQAFVGAGQGQFGAAGVATSDAMDIHHGTDSGAEDPISFEQWVKITEHLSAGDDKGMDPAEILAKYDMNAADWGTIGGHWALKMNSNVAKYGSEYSVHSEKYSTQFANEC